MEAEEDAQDAAISKAAREYTPDARSTTADSNTEGGPSGHIVIAKASDTLTGLAGTSSPQVLGNVMAANNLTYSRIVVGQPVFIPDDPYAYGDQSALGQATLNTDNARLAAITAAAARAQAIQTAQNAQSLRTAC